MPLIVSPLIAAAISALVYVIFKFFRKKLNITKESGIYIPEKQESEFIAITTNKMTSTGEVLSPYLKQTIETYNGTLLGISSQKILDNLHFLSAGVVSFARGLNDTPKIVGLLVIINALDIKWGMIAVAITMALGGLINARRVGITMSKKITPMNSGQGFTANLITGLLVTTASIHGLPVSTTHVSVGSIFGIGTITKKADPKMVSKILLSWLLTLPIAAVLSGLTFLLLRQIT
jgi:PiT family inorganic phosphate transporter